MRNGDFVSISVVFATFIYVNYGCQIVDHPLWTIPIATNILDTFEVGGIVISRGTTDIEDISNVSYGQATLGGPYFDLSIENSQLLVRTNAAFARYEEIEISSRVAINVDFSCTGGGTRTGLILWIDITDTNNNAPEFIPKNELEFIVTPPLPPGFLVTGCYNDVITVKDIDLTTYRIDFTIEENPYFEIEYDAAASTVDKEFVAQLRTKTFIRSLNEPLTLSITATDVDETPGPPLTATGIVRIVADAEFQFPEELVFDQTFYLANYTDDHQLNLLETISLRQGFDEYVNFTLEGEYYEYFGLRADGNQVSVVVLNPLPNEDWSEKQIFLIVRAEREFTSGASTTIIVQLPEEIELQFERAYYEGVIANNSLQIAPLVLSEGYEGVTVSAVVVGEYSSYFTATVQSDQVTLQMTPLMDDVIDNNSFISLQVVATSDRSSATTVVNLEIIKDDSNTPVFDGSIYSGSYDPATGLTIEQIRFVQGFDDTVTVKLSGEYANYFEIVEIGPVVTIVSSTIPPEMFSQGSILITIEASKPRTVGANAAIYVTLPTARVLEFEESTYRGSLEDGLLSLQPILLHQGYEEGVRFSLSGEYSAYFNARHERELVTIDLSNTLPDIAIAQNSVIMLALTASGLNAITTTTSVILDIIKEDTTTPVFSQPIYYGTYSGGEIEIEPINLAQGFDSSVSFRIDGAHAQYFTVNENNDVNSAIITLQSPIPEDVIFNEKVLLFNVLAEKALTVGAKAAVLIRFPTELTDSTILRFSQHTYVGTLSENEFHLIEEIVLDTGFAPGTEFILSGDYADYFSWSSTNNVVQISTSNTLPDEVLAENDFIVLEIEARRPRAVSVWTSVFVDIVKQQVVAPVFGQAYYTGTYTEETGVTFDETINLTEGYDETVTFSLSGEPEAWFLIEQEGDSLTLVSRIPVPAEVLESNNQLLFTIVANKPNAPSGRAVISLDLPNDFSDTSFRFQQDFYKGYLENDSLVLADIILEDYTSEVNYTYTGEYANFFELINKNGTFAMQLETPLPNEVVDKTNVFVFTLEAQNTFKRTYTVIIIENIRKNLENHHIEFEEPYYIGTYSTTENLQFHAEIRLTTETNQNVVFDLEGEDADWFSLVPNGNSVTVSLTSPIPPAVIANNQQLVFVVTAKSPGSATARATVVITLVDSFPEGSAMLGFDRVTYLGSIENNQANIPAITLSEGFTQGVEFILHGELQNYFRLSAQGAVVTVTLQGTIPEQLIPANRVIVLEIQASAPQAVTAYATIVIEYVVDDDVRPIIELIFAQTFYSGSYAAATGLSFPTAISLTQGYDSDVEFALEGDDAVWFGLVSNGNLVTVTLTSPIPPAVIANNQQLIFVVTAQNPGSAIARAVVVISLRDDLQPEPELTFEKVIYEGFVQNGVVNHEIIIVIGFSGSTVDLHGEYSSLFEAELSNNRVTVSASSSFILPSDTTYVVLELRAGTASAVLVLNVVQTDGPPSPTVTFTSPSYVVRVDISHTGLVGQVQASSDNGEAVTYSLQLDNDHLQERLSINGQGELHLSAPLNSGFYTFEVVAETVFTQIQGTAMVHVSVEVVTICGDEFVMPPLIILDVDEEEPHYDLINGTQYEDCLFTLTSRWPLDQTWVYVDKGGLHTTAIDREHDSIAFMAVSQVQVEVILQCEGDSTRIKRSLASDALGPYDYGSNNWILTDTILFKSRRSLVNIIVNDINDNAPIFVGKENEPIAVGYPVPDLAEMVLPRSLAELQATDADIGENAALLYWSSAAQLAVAPTTGFVHLRDGATLENGARLTVSATDRNGNGLTGSIDILVRLLDESYIAVVTVKDAFLDDEETVLSSLSEAVGYEIKVLRSVVISDEVDTSASRNKSDATNTAGASLQLYVYGLIAREPVSVDQLTADISNIVTAPVIVASSVSLQDHLEGQAICVIAGRGTGLLAATIVLSVLLFIVLVLIAVWFFLRWRKNRNYDEFSDKNSLTSWNGSEDKFPKPEVLPKPRLDIAELKKSERRLQEMLDAPIQEISVGPTSSRNDAILNMPEQKTPIVIQSIDKLKDAADESSEDEFGEVKTPRRKSVVTFNENVERIIHVEDTPDTVDLSADPDYEVYKL